MRFAPQASWNCWRFPRRPRPPRHGRCSVKAQSPATGRAPRATPARDTPWPRPLALIGAGIVLLVALGGLFQRRHRRLPRAPDPDRPQRRSDAGRACRSAPRSLSIPANMIRLAKTRAAARSSAPTWRCIGRRWRAIPNGSAEAFKDGSPSAPIVYATIAARDTPLDSTGRLDSVYARFFVGKPLPGPAGLVGRQLERRLRLRRRDRLFRARPSRGRSSPAAWPNSTPEVPATCLRDVNFGRGLSLLYRFNRRSARRLAGARRRHAEARRRLPGCA